jgi:hypothetical protein
VNAIPGRTVNVGWGMHIAMQETVLSSRHFIKFSLASSQLETLRAVSLLIQLSVARIHMRLRMVVLRLHLTTQGYTCLDILLVRVPR